GVCVAPNGETDLSVLIDFGRLCTREVVGQKDALKAASGFHLSGHGGTNDGIIGAAAAVGLTASGWNGRFIEFGGLRDFPENVLTSRLEQAGILVVSLDRDAQAPAPDDLIHTKNWLRPRLWGNQPILPALKNSEGVWESLGGKRKKG
ncbi:MAG TPA: hypothetical protein HPP90_12290, partial [Deltaproteobacteria bacterium]|nr:hypothetical protein [Deltaproteobacteria bacterium]